MRVGQPVYFKQKTGDKIQDAIGIVADVLPNKGGVMVYFSPESNKKMLVKEPHKITDPSKMMQVIQLFKDMPEIAEFLEQKFYKPAKPAAPEHKQLTEAEAKSTFDAALAEIEATFNGKPSAYDKFVLNSMGFPVADLPEIKD